MNSSTFLIATFLAAAGAHAQVLEVSDPVSSGTAALLPLSLAGHSTITGLQFDLVYPSGHAKGGAAVSLVETTNHKAEARQVSAGRNRVVLFSPTNLPLPAETILQLPLEFLDGAPAGGPDITVQNLKFVTTAGQVLTPSLRYGTVTQWRKTHFTALERADANIIGDDRDPDGDGLPNLGELASAADPKVPDGERAPQTGVAVDASNRRYLTLRYRKGKTATAAAIDAEVSPDLKSWALVDPTPLPTGNTDATTVELEARVEITGAQKFLRLKFLRTPLPTP